MSSSLSNKNNKSSMIQSKSNQSNIIQSNKLNMIQSNKSNITINQIFEVSINSNKLISIINKFQQNFNKMQTKFTQLQKQLKQNHYYLNSKIINVDNSIRSYLKDQFIQMKQQIQIKFRKSQTVNHQIFQSKDIKISQLSQQLQSIKKKIQSDKNYLEQQIQNCVKNYSTDIWGIKRNLEKQKQQNQSNINQINEKIDQCHQDMENYTDYLIELQNKIKFNLESKSRNIINCPQKTFQDSINPTKYDIKSNTSMSKLKKNKSKQLTEKRTLFKKTKQPNQQNYLSTIQYASITAKVQNLQKKLNQTGNTMGNYQLHPQQYQPADEKLKLNKKNKRLVSKISLRDNQTQKQQQSFFISSKQIYKQQDEQQSMQLVQKIILKLQKIHTLMQTKQKQLTKKISQLQDKQIINQQKIQFNKQKLSKINNQVGDVKLKMLSMQRKINQIYKMSSIPLIHEQLGKIIQRMDNQFSKKVDIIYFIKQQQKVYQKFTQYSNYLKFKAQKQDVKKAIMFLQDKIKQIILVISNQFNDEIVGSINKLQSKCLTCDKQIMIRNDNITNRNIKTSKGAQRLRSPQEQLQKYQTRVLKSKKENINIFTTRRHVTLQGNLQEDQFKDLIG